MLYGNELFSQIKTTGKLIESGPKGELGSYAVMAVRVVPNSGMIETAWLENDMPAFQMARSFLMNINKLLNRSNAAGKIEAMLRVKLSGSTAKAAGKEYFDIPLVEARSEMSDGAFKELLGYVLEGTLDEVLYHLLKDEDTTPTPPTDTPFVSPVR